MTFCKRHYIYGFAVLVTTIIICAIVGILSFSTLFLDPVGQIIKSFQFTDSYFYIENSESEVEDYNNDILLFDISGCYSRAEIAGAIQKLNDYGAKVIALDVIFGGLGIDFSESDSLLNVMNRCKDKTISANRAIPTTNGFEFESSFYIESIGGKEACVNVDNDIVRNFSNSLTFGDTTLPSFVSVIAEKADFLHNKKIGDKELINYKKMIFDRIHIFDSYSQNDIKDKIILIGDLEDLRDFHNIPIEINGTRRISGTIIHAYSLASLSDSRTITQMSKITSIIIGFILSYLFCVLCCQVSEKYDKIAGLVMNVYQIALLLILSFVGGLIFINFNYNIDLLYTMLGIGLAGFSTDLVYYFTTTKLYNIIKNKLKR